MAGVLRQRGADVSYLELYERKPLHYDDWSFLGTRTIVVLTSGESLQHFVTEVGDVTELIAIVVSERTAQMAREAGFSQVVNAGGASDQALYDAVTAVGNMRNE